MSIAAWVRAARLPAQSNIAPALLLGQALAWSSTGQFSAPIFAGIVLFGIFDQLFIVFANDVADVETDARNLTATPFSGGSRVIPEGQLSRHDLAIAGVLSAVGLMAVCAWLAAAYGRSAAPAYGALAIALLWAYSYPPCRLSYRGGGELLQALGVAIVLPTLGYYAQAGDVTEFAWPLVAALMPFQLAGAIATALPDEPSDRDSAKRTLVVMVGQRVAQRGAVALQVLGGVVFLAVASPTGPALSVLLIPLLALVAQGVCPIAQPGERAMLWRVFAILSANGAFTVGVALIAVWGVL